MLIDDSKDVYGITHKCGATWWMKWHKSSILVIHRERAKVFRTKQSFPFANIDIAYEEIDSRSSSLFDWFVSRMLRVNEDAFTIYLNFSHRHIQSNKCYNIVTFSTLLDRNIQRKWRMRKNEKNGEFSSSTHRNVAMQCNFPNWIFTKSATEC